MTTIERFFTKFIKIQRLIYDNDTKTETWQDYLDDVPCHIQTFMSGTTGYEGMKFPTHQMWCPSDVDITSGDRVIDGETIYEVLGVEELNIGRNPHLSVNLALIE